MCRAGQFWPYWETDPVLPPGDIEFLRTTLDTEAIEALEQILLLDEQIRELFRETSAG